MKYAGGYINVHEETVKLAETKLKINSIRSGKNNEYKY